MEGKLIEGKLTDDQIKYLDERYAKLGKDRDALVVQLTEINIDRVNIETTLFLHAEAVRQEAKCKKS